MLLRLGIHNKIARMILLLTLVLGLTQSWYISPTAKAQVANYVVVSEIYGGGGNSGATFKKMTLSNCIILPFNPFHWLAGQSSMHLRQERHGASPSSAETSPPTVTTWFNWLQAAEEQQAFRKRTRPEPPTCRRPPERSPLSTKLRRYQEKKRSRRYRFRRVWKHRQRL